jgi:hypothetical protein
MEDSEAKTCRLSSHWVSPPDATNLFHPRRKWLNATLSSGGENNTPAVRAADVLQMTCMPLCLLWTWFSCFVRHAEPFSKAIGVSRKNDIAYKKNGIAYKCAVMV